MEEDLVAVGQSSGDTLILRIRDKGATSNTLQAKQQRACNSIAFNREGLLATGLDRVRHDSSLNIWDINHRIGSADPSKNSPYRKLASSEVIHSVKFFDDQPNLLVAGAGYKWIRIFDLRESASNPALTAPTRCVYGIGIDKNQNYFAAYSDDGVVAVWDRRLTNRSAGQADPVLVFSKASVDENGRSSSITSLRYSPQKAGVFAVSNTAGGLRVYETAKLIEVPVSTSSLGGDTTFGIDSRGVNLGRGLSKDSIFIDAASKAPKSHETLFVNKITDVAEPLRTIGKVDRRVSSFDWISSASFAMNHESYVGELRLVCLRNDGELGILTTPGAPMSLSFSPRNGLITTLDTGLMIIPDPDNKTKVVPPLTPAAEGVRDYFRRRPSESIDGTTQLLGQMHLHQNLHSQTSKFSPPSLSADTRPAMTDRKDSMLDASEMYLYPPDEVLRNDILFVMKDRVERGYSMDVLISTTAHCTATSLMLQHAAK